MLPLPCLDFYGLADSMAFDSLSLLSEKFPYVVWSICAFIIVLFWKKAEL